MNYLPIVHICANLFWIGAVAAMAVILRAEEAPSRERGQLARVVYRRVASPAFAVSIVAGTALLLGNPAYYFVHSHWMHAKLPLALGVVALHHWFGSRSRRMAADAAPQPGPLPSALLIVGALGAAVLALLKPF